MKEKDRQFVMKALDMDDNEVDSLFERLRSMPEEGDNSRESCVRQLCDNMRGRDRYELNKILLTRLG